MYRSRGPFAPSASSSRASTSTKCQKCLKLGHYSFECKAAASERPYVSRPSRTQQLLNPSLRPALTESTPPSDAVILKKKGTADEILKSKQKERERDRALDRSDRGRKRRRESPSPGAASRTRSISTGSTSSYSSISSGRSPTPPNYSQDRAVTHNPPQTRRRSNSHARDHHERSVRRKYRDSPSPGRRGRKMSPTDFSKKKTRSPSPRRARRRSFSPVENMSVSPARKGNGGPIVKRSSPPRERSLSPFTRRKLLTEQMRRGPG
ncbi:uncharacterized protein LAJ45_00892 [Morchella importuna]|uniref:uncharacterized protein n=1 Tax=Morchella importuna TaxID=1174673 RepID=UPI001E8D5D94|nr:uncharacterized protein LAJ45_00892 [Morchella importuna]KAH8155880.1 hypothetical protein LAJ45_00892 [Morchella importuna]